MSSLRCCVVLEARDKSRAEKTCGVKHLGLDALIAAVVRGLAVVLCRCLAHDTSNRDEVPNRDGRRRVLHKREDKASALYHWVMHRA